MAWNPIVAEKLHRYLESGDHQNFAQSLTRHPEHLRAENGSEYWLWQAAIQGRLPIIKELVQLGLNINEPHDHGDPDDQFYEPEGVILQAATAGHLDVVRWLLERGAQINYVVQGQPRCLPLIQAATAGHLDVVKLLIAHGADVQATWNGVNAISQAEDFGHWAIVDYLRALGARTLRETTPPDYPMAHQRILKDMTEVRGPVSDWRRELPGEPAVTLFHIPVNEKNQNVQTILTVGLSDHRLPHGRYEYACTELRVLLPPDWPLTETALQDPQWNWPIEGLTQIVDQLRQCDRWPDKPVLFFNGDPPQPLAAGTQQCAWLALQAQGEMIFSPDYRNIDIHSLFPIYAEEAELVQQRGHQELLDRFMAHDLPLGIAPQRPNTAAH